MDLSTYDGEEYLKAHVFLIEEARTHARTNARARAHTHTHMHTVCVRAHTFSSPEARRHGPWRRAAMGRDAAAATAATAGWGWGGVDEAMRASVTAAGEAVMSGGHHRRHHRRGDREGRFTATGPPCHRSSKYLMGGGGGTRR